MYACVRMHMYVYIYIHTHIHTHMHTYIAHIHTHMYIHSHKLINSSRIHIPESIAAGRAHCLALDEQGHVWAWGDNSRGQLGCGKDVAMKGDAVAAVAVDGIQTRIVAVAAGGNGSGIHSLGFCIISEYGIHVWNSRCERLRCVLCPCIPRANTHAKPSVKVHTRKT